MCTTFVRRPKCLILLPVLQDNTCAMTINNMVMLLRNSVKK